MSFVYPAFLYGLAALAVPVIIHFFNFQRSKKVYFTNVAFLSSVKEITNARNKLRNILVLIARLLFIFFLVMAFAQPFIPNENARALSQSNQVSIYFDNSYSLQNESDNRRLFDMGITYIDEISDLFPGNTTYQLLDNAFEGNPNLFYERDRLGEKLSEVGFSNNGRELEYVYGKQMEAFDNTSSRGGHIFWVSDFQKSSVGDIAKLSLDTLHNFYLVPMQPTNMSNLYIDSVWMENPFIREKENNVLHVKVQNNGQERLENRAIKLFVDDKQLASNSISIGPNTFEEVELTFAVSSAGEKRCKVVIDDFPIAFDNEYFFILKVAPKIRIVNIYDGQERYIADVYSGESFFEVSTYDVNALNYSDLESADLIVLNGLAEIDRALLVSLQRAMAGGTSLAVFPGARLSAESYTGLLQMPIVDQAVYRDQEQAPIQVGIEPPSMQNPFFEGVFEKVSPNMSMPKGAPVINWSGMGRQLLKFKDNKPFLTAFSRGSGSLFLFSAPLDERYTNFPKHALFVPVLYKIALNSKIRNDRISWSFNDPIATVTIDSLGQNDIFKLVNGDFELIPAQRIAGGQLLLNIPKNDIDAGNYQVVKTTTGDIFGNVAFNYDARESEIGYFNADELREIFGERQNVQVFGIDDEQELKSEFQDKNVAKPLYRYALLLALLFLLAEILLIRFWKEA